MAEEPSPVDKLQGETRTETVRSMNEFMISISDLEPHVQARLLKARLINTRMIFKNDRPWIGQSEEYYRKCQCSEETDYPRHPYYISSLATGKNIWSLSYVIYYGRNYGDRLFRLETVVNIEPNSLMLEWMRARDEYAEYSKEKISGIDATVNISGKIDSFTWEQNTGGNFFVTSVLKKQKVSWYKQDMISCKLTMTLNPFSPDAIASWKLLYSLPEHTNILNEKIAEWVKYYMGKGEKPKPILDKN